MTDRGRRPRSSGRRRVAPSRWNSRTGWTTSPGSLPSYRWKRPWSMTTGVPPSVPSSSRPTWPGRGRRRPAGQVGERDGDGVLEIVGEAAEPGPEDDPDLGHEVGPLADRGLERGEAGGLLGRRDGRVGSRRDRRRLAVADQSCGPPGSASRGRTAEARGFVGPTEVSTPGCRSRPVGRGPRGSSRGETAARAGQRSARSDRRRIEDP